MENYFPDRSEKGFSTIKGRALIVPLAALAFVCLCFATPTLCLRCGDRWSVIHNMKAANVAFNPLWMCHKLNCLWCLFSKMFSFKTPTVFVNVFSASRDEMKKKANAKWDGEESENDKMKCCWNVEKAESETRVTVECNSLMWAYKAARKEEGRPSS